MAVYCVSYDLKSNNYDLVIDAIKSFGVWWHQSESTWFIGTDHSSRYVLDTIRNFMDVGDKLVVIRVQQDWWGVGHTDEEYNWLKSKEF